MPSKEEFLLHPLGYENDPEEERFPLSSVDYQAAQTYNNYAIFFKLDDNAKKDVATVLKTGLEMTLSQARQLVGSIEKDVDGDHSFVKKKDSIVKFVVQWLDSPADGFPSFADIENAHFTSTSLGDLTVLSIPSMLYGENPKCHPDANPVISGFQANFIPGGLIFNMHNHHYANDVMGWAAFVHQLADNCYSIIHKTTPPAWDPACLDHSRLMDRSVANEAKVDAPPGQPRHPDLKQAVWLLCHVPKSKAAELKKAATPDDGTWISTYDACTALLWRALTKYRVPLYKADPAAAPFWVEAANMRTRCEPPVPIRTQGNVLYFAASPALPTQLTSSEIISGLPLSGVASYVRKATNSATHENFTKTLAALAMVRDKTALFTRANSFPPLSMGITDWRDTNICEADFGFAKPTAYRHLFDIVSEGMVLVYPPRNTGNPDEGCEFVVACETAVVKDVMEDSEFSKYFEFRAFDAEESTVPN